MKVHILFVLFKVICCLNIHANMDGSHEYVDVSCGAERTKCYSQEHTQGSCCDGLLCEWDNVGWGICTKNYPEWKYNCSIDFFKFYYVWENI